MVAVTTSKLTTGQHRQPLFSHPRAAIHDMLRQWYFGSFTAKLLVCSQDSVFSSPFCDLKVMILNRWWRWHPGQYATASSCSYELMQNFSRQGRFATVFPQGASYSLIKGRIMIYTGNAWHLHLLHQIGGFLHELPLRTQKVIWCATPAIVDLVLRKKG